MNISKSQICSIGSKARIHLNNLLKTGIEVIKHKDVVNILHVNSKTAYKLLFYWHRHGWLNRVKWGVYSPIPLDVEIGLEAVEDPWILADKIYQPSYLGGWTAAQHWDLTEQIFQTTMVFSSKYIRQSYQKMQNVDFKLKRIDLSKMFGLKKIWRGQFKVQVSDPSRTLIDMLSSPHDLGGIRFIIDVIWEYFHSEHKDIKKLIEYSERLGKGVVNKRLGLILEKMFPDEKWLIQECVRLISKGPSQLDPSNKGNLFSYKWQLWYPQIIFEDGGLRDTKNRGNY